MNRLIGDWYDLQAIPSHRFQCGYCEAKVSSNRGLNFNNGPVRLYICPECTRPTYFEGEKQYPGVASGTAVKHLPSVVEALYNEARNCEANNNNTAAVLCARKLLMHIAVDQGAPAKQSFMEHVEYLAANGFVPPNGKGWVDHIRTKGNEANHEIVLMTKNDSGDLITFSEMLLKFIYEFPKRIPAQPSLQP